MLSAILGAIFLREKPEKKTWVAIIITFTACVYIFYDSLSLGNFYGDLFGLITAFGLACNANLARYAKTTDLVPSAVIGKLCVAIFAFFFVKDFALVGTDMIFIPIMCVMCVAIPFVLVTIAPRFITAAEVNLFFLLPLNFAFAVLNFLFLSTPLLCSIITSKFISSLADFGKVIVDAAESSTPPPTGVADVVMKPEPPQEPPNQEADSSPTEMPVPTNIPSRDSSCKRAEVLYVN